MVTRKKDEKHKDEKLMLLKEKNFRRLWLFCRLFVSPPTLQPSPVTVCPYRYIFTHSQMKNPSFYCYCIWDALFFRTEKKWIILWLTPNYNVRFVVEICFKKDRLGSSLVMEIMFKTWNCPLHYYIQPLLSDMTFLTCYFPSSRQRKPTTFLP